MKLAIMQPYFLPYIGYFQLMSLVDDFIIYDNIEYSKKGWINRNRILVNGRDALFTIPLKKDSDYLDVNGRYLSDDSMHQRSKLLRQIEGVYRKAPEFQNVYPIVEKIFSYQESNNLFDFIFHSIVVVRDYLRLPTSLLISSRIEGDKRQLGGVDRVLNLCKIQGAKTYINPTGGQKLYSKELFRTHGIELLFHQIDNVEYQQFQHNMVPNLSILDVMMFNSPDVIDNLLKKHTLY